MPSAKRCLLLACFAEQTAPLSAIFARGGKPFTMEWCDGILEENPPACVLPTPDAVAAERKMRMKTVPAIGKMIRSSKAG